MSDGMVELLDQLFLASRLIVEAQVQGNQLGPVHFIWLARHTSLVVSGGARRLAVYFGDRHLVVWVNESRHFVSVQY